MGPQSGENVMYQLGMLIAVGITEYNTVLLGRQHCLLCHRKVELHTYHHERVQSLGREASLMVTHLQGCGWEVKEVL